MSFHADAPAVAGELLKANRILLLTHERPDGDATGSVFGMKLFLESAGKQVDVLMPTAPPKRFGEFLPGWLTSVTEAEVQTQFDLILLLDCANPERIAGGELTADFLRTQNFISVDHHAGNTVSAPIEWVDAKAAAASLLATEIALATGLPIPPQAATLWLLGILTDTGNFRFSNTDGRALRLTAELLDNGAELERVVNAVYFTKPRSQQQFESEMLKEHIRFAADGKLVYAYLPDELFEKYKFNMRDGEGLIDLLREIEGTVIALLFYRKGDSFKCSLRSKDARYPVGPLARSLGGGGHQMAAGITLNCQTPEEVEQCLIEKITVLLQTAQS